jgi:hypothetical protein
MNDLEKKLDDFSKIKGVTSNMKDEFAAVLNDLAGKQEMKSIDDKIAAFRDGIKSPMQKYEEAIDLLDQMKRRGLTNDEYAAGVQKARADLENSVTELQSPKLAASMRYGSGEAAISRQKLQLELGGLGKGKIEEQQLATQKETRDLAREQRDLLKNIGTAKMGGR